MGASNDGETDEFVQNILIPANCHCSRQKVGVEGIPFRYDYLSCATLPVLDIHAPDRKSVV